MKILTDEERLEFELLVHKTRNVNERNRLCVILAYDEGYEIEEIVNILKISKSSIYDYINDYNEKKKTSNDKHLGKPCNLTLKQEELKLHLQQHTYIKAKDICSHVYSTYQVKYTTVGIIKWLIRNNFRYKKPKKVPGKLDEQKQQKFIQEYNNLKENLPEDEAIIFMDAVHPEYQSQAVCGWIPKGETKTISTTNKQFRVHINGTIELNSLNIFTKKYQTIDASSVINFLKDLQENENYKQYKKIHIICDNGRANKNKELDKYLKENPKIVVHYLPPYSPNLNPIERLWKVMQEKVTYNKTYTVFKEFENAINQFFENTVHNITDILSQRINDKFEVIKHNPVQVIS